VEEDATGRIVAKGSLEITVLEEEEATLVSIAITTPADVLTYEVGDDLDITGLVVTGTYSDDSTSTEAITGDNITGFDSSEPEDNQVLTVTVGGKTATYTVDIIAIPITAIGAIIGTPQFGAELTAGALTPSTATATYQWRIAATSGGTYADIVGATSNTYTPVATDVTKYLKVVATGTGNYSGTVTSAATELGVAAIPVTAIGDITGTAKVGRTLTAGAVVPAGATVNYSWNRGNEANGTYNSIDGASSATYTLTASDEGKFIRVRVVGRDGYSEEVMSNPTEAVVARNSRSSGSSRSSGTAMPPAGFQTIAQMQATVNLLIAQINALIAQAKAQGIQLTGTSGAGGTGSPIVLSAVVRPLFLGVSGADVNALQNFLISQNKGAAAAALKNHGATNYFGPLTKAALAEFQASAGLPATGYFGPLTKAYLKTLGF
jgi:peptidoglycan hydrolase-like protein with peptidoglycan-binding domain